MPVKSSRFVRTSYANRAAQLANELDDWQSIYLTQRFGDSASLLTQREADHLEMRLDVLADVVAQLRDISIRLLAIQ